MPEETKTATITCPRCGAQGEAPIWDEIDAQTARRDARHVLNETLFEVKCNQCGNASSLNYPLVYHDGTLKFLVQYVTDPNAAEQAGGDIERTARHMIGKAARAAAAESKTTAFEAEAAGALAAASDDALDGYTLRIVTTRDDLREKVVVLRNGLDDRAVEVLKLTTFNLAASQNKLKGATSARFGGITKAGDILVEFVGGRRHRETKVPAALYEQVRADVATSGDEELIIGRAWAERFLEHKADAQA